MMNSLIFTKESCNMHIKNPKFPGGASRCLISGGVQSEFLPNPAESMHCTHVTRLPPGDLQKQWKILAFLHAPSKGGSYAYRQNLTLIAEPL